MNNFRPVAYPLITVDPFFSVWSFSDKLDDTHTRHWTGRPAPLFVAIKLDGVFYPICAFDRDYVNRYNPTKRFMQKSVEVTPLSTVYVFENQKARVTLEFTTPLLLDRLDVMARPVSYVEYKVERIDGVEGGVEFFFGISAECTVNNTDRKVEFKKTPYSLCVGNTVQNPLAYSGDHVLIDWGYLHLCDTSAFVTTVEPYTRPEITKEFNAYTDRVYLAVNKTDPSGVITLAYDEINPIEYFGEPMAEYYKKYFDSFGDMVRAAKVQYTEIKELCRAFDKKLTDEAAKLGENYKNIVTLAYRQTVSAHKLIEDKEGNLIFLSKENHSNGCIGTLDVTYPSIPLFLKYNPELVISMLRPIVKYAQTPEWPYPFTPHDVGRYPLASGQFYHPTKIEKQMPVEEAGNMMLCLAAYKKYAKNTAFFDENKDLMRQWTQYLIDFGYDPGNQLCTDDFAGHLAHNCNLSVKAILGIAAFADLSGEEKYMDIAREYATRWERDAKASAGTRLVFDRDDTWSLKYNMVWDNILGYRIFTDEVKASEIALYKTKMNEYGIPLDSRADYTKIDWLMWSTRLTEDDEYFDMVCDSMVKMINEAYDRVPLTDWYCTKTAIHHAFQARSVTGGLYINMI
ncbi:MAG: DUF4965 domain-containing protein [Clostridia bacterium]|nr:DUF4965 domain-containing protein [Clostridia bacterium]